MKNYSILLILLSIYSCSVKSMEQTNSLQITWTSFEKNMESDLKDLINLRKSPFLAFTPDKKEIEEVPLSNKPSNNNNKRIECDYQNNLAHINLPNKLNKYAVAINSKDRLFGCELCNGNYKTLSALNKHKQSVHFGIRYECLHCYKKFTCKSSLKDHIVNKHMSL